MRRPTFSIKVSAEIPVRNTRFSISWIPRQVIIKFAIYDAPGNGRGDRLLCSPRPGSEECHSS